MRKKCELYVLESAFSYHILKHFSFPEVGFWKRRLKKIRKKKYQRKLGENEQNEKIKN